MHALLDKCLGFSLRDLVMKTPEEKEEFGRKLEELIKEAEAEKEEKKT